ncbi:SDR family NAD(P)-dependent oxidoreductase [Candidatus Chlorohelix sp.]|uniref:SDR family NAD(P)-dependent oxidoreductase n=1 Tax=Candidatus Chlorohelix sp. TaxID=3139201 RepID=UPI0030286DC2
MSQILSGKTIFITGGTRGIGKAIALMAAQQGAQIAITYRDPAKMRRAMQAKHELEKSGAQVLLLQLDITDGSRISHCLQETKQAFGKIDGLILNAAGGLEADKDANYAMRFNRDANLWLLNGAREMGLLGKRAWAIFITSTWAHDYPKIEPPSFYLSVAITKRAAEDALLSLVPELAQSGVGMGVVVAPLVSDTGAFAVIKLRHREVLSQETEEGRMISPETVAEATLSFLKKPEVESGHIIYL